MNAPQQKKKQSGFTLIELVIIMAIIGILGAVGAVKFASMKDDAGRTAAQAALANMRSGLAIAIAKNVNKSITVTELGPTVEGTLTKTDGTTLKWVNSGVTYNVTVDSADDVKYIQSLVDANNANAKAP